MSGWALRDVGSPLRTLVGTLTEVHHSDGDGDMNLTIVPDGASAVLLTNRKGVDNRDGTIEYEINLTKKRDGRSRYEKWVSSMIGIEVTATGVYVDDTGHDDKTEIHPMDLIVARVEGSALARNWIEEVARQNGLQVGVGLFAYRYAAASDNRDDSLPDGVGDGWPPLARVTRATSVTLRFPPRPAGAQSPQVEARSRGARNAGSHIDTEVIGDAASAKLVVTVKAAGDGGPGFDLAEVVLYWVGSRVLAVSPTTLDFGLIGIGELTVRTFAVTNAGSSPVTITVAGSTFPSAFSWRNLPATTLPPGGSIPITVEFSPLHSGVHTDTVSVVSDAAGSPHVVRLNGRARQGIPQ